MVKQPFTVSYTIAPVLLIFDDVGPDQPVSQGERETNDRSSTPMASSMDGSYRVAKGCVVGRQSGFRWGCDRITFETASAFWTIGSCRSGPRNMLGPKSVASRLGKS